MMNINFPDLKDKVILVTGASRGIGKTISEELARQGAHIVFNYRGDLESATKVQNSLEKIGGKATPIKFDLSRGDQIKESITEFVKEHGYISGLVNNAGMSKDQIVLRLKDEDISKTLDVNLKGPILIAGALSRSFLKAENVSVVNIGSVVGLMGNSSQISYAASKAGLIGFTKSIAKELGSRNVRCNAVCPGFIETEMTDKLDDKKKEAYLTEIPINRFGTTREVANLVCFLLSQSSSYITGETIKIDGGLYI